MTSKLFSNPHSNRSLFSFAGAAMVLVGSVSSASAQVTAKQPTSGRAVAGYGEVTANDVYVRSGDSTNHYTVCKLDAGARVAILGQRGAWFEIVPPPGTFSLISGDYVDSADNQTGLVSGDNVRVRAGSMLNDNKYTVQTMLKKGAPVTILGRNPDGFLRIKPPAGASLWIHSDFVARIKAAPGTVPTGASATGTGSAPQAKTASVGGVLGSAVPAGAGSRRAGATLAGSTPWREQLDEIDVAAKAEVAKAPVGRDFTDVIERYRVVSQQSEDEYARVFAVTRLEQIDNMVTLAAAVQKIQRLGDAADAKRRAYLSDRATIPPVAPLDPSGIQIQGELRVSALYPPGSTIRRYRLIDPTASFARTIGYVEIPPGSDIDPAGFLGRYVGVRASQRRLQEGGVDPIPIYLAIELVLLEAPVSAEPSTSPDE